MRRDELKMRPKLRCWENSGPVLLSEILDWCTKQYEVDTLLATARASEDAQRKRSFDSRVEQAALSIFGASLIEQFNARGWPGTELIGHTGKVYVVRFDEAMKRRMIGTEDNLFNWTHYPPKRLPEDICLFKKGSNHPILASVTHEKNAYVLTQDGPSPPGFERTDYDPKEMMLAWDGPYFCLL